MTDDRSTRSDVSQRSEPQTLASGRSGIDVLKLGGSLLELATWPQRLQSWLAEQPRKHFVLVVGGGPWVDSLRQLDRQHGLGEAYCHELAGRLLSLTAGLAGRQIFRRCRDGLDVRPSVTLADILGAPAALDPTLWILDAGYYLLVDSPASRQPLPCDWTVTSDSIAADVARCLGAERLVLFKSCPPPGQGTVAELADSDSVDPYFASLAGQLPCVEWVNLRGLPE